MGKFKYYFNYQNIVVALANHHIISDRLSQSFEYLYLLNLFLVSDLGNMTKVALSFGMIRGKSRRS